MVGGAPMLPVGSLDVGVEVVGSAGVVKLRLLEVDPLLLFTLN